MAFATNKDVVQAFAAQRANQSLGYAILPRRSGRYRTITDAHRSDPGGEDMPISAVIVAK